MSYKIYSTYNPRSNYWSNLAQKISESLQDSVNEMRERCGLPVIKEPIDTKKIDWSKVSEEINFETV